jgi:uncharacterized protein (TIGR00730 family)
MITSLCVFCGSQFGSDRSFRAAAARLGELAAAAGIKVIYGGGRVGLMGAAADATMAAGGEVVGLIPARLLEREVGHPQITELVVTRDMFDRKDQMIARADGFVVLPGGLGTLDELLEVLTLRQLGYHSKPIVVVNIAGYWDPLLRMVDQIVDQGFAAPSARDLFSSVTSIEQVLPALGVATLAQTARVAGTT